MTTIDMEADSKGSVVTSAPKFDKVTPREWAEDLEIHLMTRKRLHLGLKARPVDLAANASADNKQVRKTEQSLWDERNESVYGTIMILAKNAGSEVREAVMNHHRQTGAGANVDRVAKILLDFLVARFEGKTQSAIEKSTAEYISFMVTSGEKVEASIDRLDCIIQRLEALGQPPSAASKVERLKAGLKITSLKFLVFNIAMLPANTTYAELCEHCRKYDDAAVDALLDDIKKPEKPEAHFNDDNGDVVTCGYPHCRKKGHTQEFCRIKKRHQQMQAAKRKRNGGKPKDDKSDKSDDNSRQLPGSKAYSGCHKCGSKEHLGKDCKKQDKDTSKKRDWRDYTSDNGEEEGRSKKR
jgi:hypothetical protein